MYSWECDSETMSFGQNFGRNEALNKTQLTLYFFSMLDQNSALPQSEGDLMTPHLLNLVHVAVRSRFEGAQIYGHIIIRILRSKIVYSASLAYVAKLKPQIAQDCGDLPIRSGHHVPGRQVFAPTHPLLR